MARGVEGHTLLRQAKPGWKPTLPVLAGTGPRTGKYLLLAGPVCRTKLRWHSPHSPHTDQGYNSEPDAVTYRVLNRQENRVFVELAAVGSQPEAGYPEQHQRRHRQEKRGTGV